MTEVNNAAPETSPEELVEITSIPQFAAMVAGWHANVCSQIDMGINVPDDVSIEVGIKEGEAPVELNPDMRLGFKAGLVMALSIIQDLPFQGIADSVEAPAGGDEGTAQ
jgi:hypothetical protein